MSTININTLKRFIAKKGKEYVINYLSSSNLPKETKRELEKIGVFVNGILNLDLIHSLSAPSLSQN